jgi:Holliday junction DNA helicase RuvA
MIAKLTGVVDTVEQARVVLNVGGVGYLLFMSRTETLTPGDTISLFTYLAVRENALDLYGFVTEAERTMFEHLIKIPKIGPKTAREVLAQADNTTLKRAVRDNDATYLSKMSGIGKKSAEKIVQGLKDVLDEDDLGVHDTHKEQNQSDTDVVEALLSLGYSERDARVAVQKIPREILGTNERIKYALKEVSRP